MKNIFLISLSILTLLTFEFVYGQATQPKVKIDKISSIPTPEGYNIRWNVEKQSKCTILCH